MSLTASTSVLLNFGNVPLAHRHVRQQPQPPRAQPTLASSSRDDAPVSLPVNRRTALGLAGLVPLLPFAVPVATASELVGPQEVIGDLAAATVLGEPITDPRILLRNALPANLQANPIAAVEDVVLELGGKAMRSAAGSRSDVALFEYCCLLIRYALPPMCRDNSIAQSADTYENVNTVDQNTLSVGVRKAQAAVRRDYDGMLASFPAANRGAAEKLLNDMESVLSNWSTKIEKGAKYDQKAVTDLKNDLLNITSTLQ
eukprot:7970344-Pyramimonas_sp.AAC.1